MSLTKINLTFILLFSVSSVFSQNKISNTFITGNFENYTLTRFAEYLRESFDLFVYYQPQITDTLIVNHNFKNKNLTDALDEVLGKFKLDYVVIQDDGIVILPLSNTSKVKVTNDAYADILVVGNSGNRGKQKQALLRGRVINGKNGERLPSAVLYNLTTDEGITTNFDGEFEWTLNTGMHSLKINFMGFNSRFQKIELIEDGEIIVELFEESHDIEEVTVVGEDYQQSRTQMSISRILPEEIKKLPVLMGEADVIKSIVMMPGIQSVGELSSGFNVRGGNTDQNLVLLDGAPVYNTSHLFGFFSMINPDAVSDVVVYKGGLPPSFGSRVSSVMEVELKKGNTENLKLYGGIGLINSRLTVEGPFTKKSRSSFLIGGRSTYSDWMLRNVKNIQFDKSTAKFYDLNGNLNIHLGEANYVQLMGYLSADKFNLDPNSLYNYSNTISSLNWVGKFGPGVTSKLSLSYSKYDFSLTDNDEYFSEFSYRLKTGIENTGAKYSLLILPSEQLKFHFGGEAENYRIRPGEVLPVQDSTQIIQEKVEGESGIETAFFFNTVFDWSDRFIASAGLRLSGFYNLGESTVYIYPENEPKRVEDITDSLVFSANELVKKFSGIEPRFSVKYSLLNGATIRGSYQRVTQYLSQISNTSVVSPTDIWKTSDYHLDPLISDQFGVGYFADIYQKKIETSAEVYYKKLQNLLEYKNGAQLVMNHKLETDLIPAEGYSYGLELYFKKQKGQFNGWLSYTYSRTMRRTSNLFEEEIINNRRYYPSVYDKPHDLSAVANYQISRRWRFSGNFVFASGRPTTLPEQKYLYKHREMIYYSDRNKYRMPPYHRLDVSITLDENLRKKRMWKGSWTFSVYNLYGRNNPYSVYFLKESSQVGNADKFNLFKFSVIGVPVPSLTYNFIF